MADIFNIHDKDLIALRKLYKKAPKKFQTLTANLLTSMAFGNRTESSKIIHNRMTVRNPKFVSRALRIVGAKKTSSIHSQKALFGSLRFPRFSGWIEQETGKKPEIDRISFLSARRGNIQKQIAPSFRLRKGRKYISDDDFQGSNRTNAMLQMLARQKYNKPFVIKGKHKKLKRGLYKFHRRKLIILQQFSGRKNKVTRIKWLSLGRKLYFAKNDLRNLWNKSIKFVFKK